MVDPIDAATWPSLRGPWPEVSDISRVYDHGWRWCVNARGHPQSSGGYPDVQRHDPWDECRTHTWFLDGARRGLSGPEVELSVYGAAAFRFGQPRDGTSLPRPRVVIESYDLADEASQPGLIRLSVPIGEARQFARLLGWAADSLTPSL